MYTVLMNPGSHAMKSGEFADRIFGYLDSHVSEYKVLYTDPRIGTDEVVREALSESPEALIVCGGDGTLFEVSDAICDSDVPLIIVPAGTGNDFYKMLGLPTDPVETLEIQLKTKPRPIDIGRVNNMHFMNVAGTGFDVQVLRQAEKYKYKYKGIIPYFFGLVSALKHYKPVSCELTVDNSAPENVHCAIISIGNGRYIGGGMKAVPSAEIDDGYFDLICVKPVHIGLILPLIILYILGLHEKIGLATVRKCKRVTVSCPGMTVNLDGELRETDTAVFEICEKAVQLKVPKPASV